MSKPSLTYRYHDRSITVPKLINDGIAVESLDALAEANRLLALVKKSKIIDYPNLSELHNAVVPHGTYATCLACGVIKLGASARKRTNQTKESNIMASKLKAPKSKAPKAPVKAKPAQRKGGKRK